MCGTANQEENQGYLTFTASSQQCVHQGAAQTGSQAACPILGGGSKFWVEMPWALQPAAERPECLSSEHSLEIATQAKTVQALPPEARTLNSTRLFTKVSSLRDGAGEMFSLQLSPQQSQTPASCGQSAGAVSRGGSTKKPQHKLQHLH